MHGEYLSFSSYSVPLGTPATVIKSITLDSSLAFFATADRGTAAMAAQMF